MDFYQKSVEEALAELKSGRSGITAEEARARRATYGPNELVEKKKKSMLLMFLEQFKDFMILVLIAAAVVSGIIGEPSDTIAIIVILVLNAALGFSQEYRAEKAMAALKKMAAASAAVLRSGERVILPAAEIVPGDIVLIEAGNVVPADLRVIESASLSVDEAALTGESLPVEKHIDPLPDDALPFADRKNMLYKGTVVTYGRGRGVATATAMKTELGRIATMLQQEEGRTPLQKRLAHFGRRISIVILIICAVVFAAGLFRGEPVVNIFLVAVSLAVAAIPEALPAVVTIALALGARKMVMQNALVRKLPAVETLGSVTYICTDKTGTLTLNKMTVEELWVDGQTVRSADLGVRSESGNAHPGPVWDQLLLTPNSLLPTFLTALALSNDAGLDSNGACVGDPTETALLAAARDHGYGKQALEAAYPRVAEIPFDSERKLMTTIHKGSGVWGQGAGKAGEYFSITKGAFDVLIDRADFVLSPDGPKPIKKDDIQAAHDRMAAEGLRVIAVGLRTWAELPDVRPAENVESGLILLGLVGMMDPPREEAMKAVTECRSAGITPVMITGDHPLTARVIARRVGILESNDPEVLITGSELAALPLEEFEKRVESIRVYARVAPEQKLKIVRALQDRGHFVAMTGDGVNDAPALKRADIGVAMGITGTDVAKEASAMILLDDNFATIVRAVREGRKIYDNIRKFIRYLLATNSGEIWTLFLAPFFGLPIPLQPIHILWINLVTDSLPALALTLEPGEANLMSRPPRSPREGLFSHGLGAHAIWVGLLMAAVVLGLQAWSIHILDAHWQTMVFTTLCLLQLGHVMAIRSERESLFTQGVLSNKVLFMTVVITIALQLLTVYVPALNPVFRTQPLSARELIMVLALSSIVFFGVEIEKLIKRSQKTA
jgi:Ca2+-transporting ATPase